MDNFIFLPARSRKNAGNSATGKLSVALGQHCTASGEYSLADGSGCIASTTCSVALGNAADASGTCGFMYKDICDNTFCFDSGGQNGNTAHIKINGNVVASGGGGGSRGGMVTIDGNSVESADTYWDAIPELRNLHPSTAVKLTLIGPGGAGGVGGVTGTNTTWTGGGGGGGGGVIFWTDASTARGYRPDLHLPQQDTNLYSTGTSAFSEPTQVQGYPGTTMDRQQLLVAYRGGDAAGGGPAPGAPGAPGSPGPGGGVSGSWIPPYAHRPRDDPGNQPAIMMNVCSASGEPGEPGVPYNPNGYGHPGPLAMFGRGGDPGFGGPYYGRGGKGLGAGGLHGGAHGGCIIIEWFS